MMSDIDRRTIFGYHVGITSGPDALTRRIGKELSLYPVAEAGELPRLDIAFVDSLPVDDGGYVNPAIHVDLPNGFEARYGSLDVRYETEGDGSLVRIKVAVRRGTRLGDMLYRARHIQYTTVEDMVGQLLHELVLVPSVYFQDRLALFHAAAVASPEDGVTLIGGTGGVGKTSLELELCRHRGMKFVADDIAVVDADGRVWPNLSYPKIYGYNVVDDAGLKKTLLKGAGPIDRLHWNVKHRRSPARVRRRISPLDLYGGHSATGGPLKRYLIIVRDRSPGMDTRKIDTTDAARMTLAVMQTEYNVFDNQVRWHEYNRTARGATPILTLPEVHRRWERIYASALQDVECVLLRASKDIPHKRFIASVAETITAESKDLAHA